MLSLYASLYALYAYKLQKSLMRVPTYLNML